MFFLAGGNYFPNLQNTFPFHYRWQQLQIFFQGLSDIHKKTFCENLKVIGTSQDEWLSCDKNHPKRCVSRKNYVFVKKVCF